MFGKQAMDVAQHLRRAPGSIASPGNLPAFRANNQPVLEVWGEQCTAGVLSRERARDWMGSFWLAVLR